MAYRKRVSVQMCSAIMTGLTQYRSGENNSPQLFNEEVTASIVIIDLKILKCVCLKKHWLRPNLCLMMNSIINCLPSNSKKNLIKDKSALSQALEEYGDI